MSDCEIFYAQTSEKIFSLSMDKNTFITLIDDFDNVTNSQQYFLNKPFVNYTIPQIQDFYILNELDNEYKIIGEPLKYSNIVFNISPEGFNIIIYYNKQTLLFNIFTIKKHYNLNIKKIFNLNSYVNLISSAKKYLNKKNEIKRFQYFDNFDINVNETKYTNCSFFLTLTDKLVNELKLFFQNFCENWNDFYLKKYDNLKIYFNETWIEKHIGFDMVGIDKSYFLINFVQNRLFIILLDEIENELVLVSDYLYLTAYDKSHKINIFKNDISKKNQNNDFKLYFNKDDNTYMLNRYCLARYKIKKNEFFYNF